MYYYETSFYSSDNDYHFVRTYRTLQGHLTQPVPLVAQATTPGAAVEEVRTCVRTYVRT